MKFLQNLFQTVTNNPINSKTALKKKKPKAVKPRGGVRGRYDRGQRFNVGFFYFFPYWIVQLDFQILLRQFGTDCFGPVLYLGWEVFIDKRDNFRCDSHIWHSWRLNAEIAARALLILGSLVVGVQNILRVVILVFLCAFYETYNKYFLNQIIKKNRLGRMRAF